MCNNLKLLFFKIRNFSFHKKQFAKRTIVYLMSYVHQQHQYDNKKTISFNYHIFSTLFATYIKISTSIKDLDPEQYRMTRFTRMRIDAKQLVHLKILIFDFLLTCIFDRSIYVCTT